MSEKWIQFLEIDIVILASLASLFVALQLYPNAKNMSTRLKFCRKISSEQLTSILQGAEPPNRRALP